MQRDDDDHSMEGQDSFIDVICNMVGILIVLVAIMGMRAARAPEELFASAIKAANQRSGIAPRSANAPDAADVATLKARLDQAVHQAHSVEDEVKSAFVQAVDLRRQSELVDAQREELLLARTIVEKQIDERRAKLDGTGQRQFDVQRQITESQVRLHELTQEQVSLLAEPTKVESVECVPTPLAKTVDGDDRELHVRLKHGQLAVVPTQALIDELVNRGGDYLRTGLSQHQEAQDTYGPIDGFRMRFSVERYEEVLPGASPLTPVRRSAIVQTAVFLPTTDAIGQGMEQALLPDSRFMQTLRAKRSTAPAVVAWVYPDSYAELRSLKKALWEQAVPLAVRPLNQGQPIVFSTAGSRASAQ